MLNFSAASVARALAERVVREPAHQVTAIRPRLGIPKPEKIPVTHGDDGAVLGR